MVMLTRVALCLFLSLMLLNIAWAEALLPKNSSEKTKINPLQKGSEINVEQTRKSEAEILESLDNLTQQGNNEIFLVESQKSLIKNSQQTKNNEEDKTSHDLVHGEDMMLNDGFDELDLDEMFTDLQSDLLNNDNQKKKIKGSIKEGKAEKKYGVGIVGDEAVLINTLDHSNLMDFENEVDIWSKKIVEDKKKNKKTKSANN